MGFQPEHPAFLDPIPLTRDELDAFRIPARRQAGGVRFQGIEPGIGGWRAVVPFHEPRCFFRAPAREPALVEPVRMRMAKSGFFRLEFGQQRARLVLFAPVAPEHGVDKAGLRAKTQLPGQFDGFVHGGVVRHAIQPKHLIQTQLQ